MDAAQGIADGGAYAFIAGITDGGVYAFIAGIDGGISA